MDLISRYLLKQLIITLIFITVSLTFAVWLTQILRFLELVVDSGAPAGAFFELLLLTIPRFLEIVLPIGLLASILFIYNKMIADNELIVMRATGFSQQQLAKPTAVLAVFLAIFIFFLSGWGAPLSHAKLQELRQEIKAEYSSLLIREGVFNSFGKDITVYVRDKLSNGELKGLLIHQIPKDDTEPSTIVAQKGLLIGDEDSMQVVVYQGSRQQKDRKTGYVSRLDFDQYTIDITPEKKEARIRWIEPDERTFNQLLNIDPNNPRDMAHQSTFTAEIHKRLATPFFLISFALLALTCLIVGPFNRRGQTKRIVLCIGIAIVLQSLFLTFTSMAQDSIVGIAGLYSVSIIPILVCWMLMRGISTPVKTNAKTKGDQQ